MNSDVDFQEISVLISNGRLKEADKKLNKIIKKEKDTNVLSNAYLLKGEICKQKEKLEDANEFYAKIIEMNKEHGVAWKLWGANLMALKKYDQAIEKIAKAFELNPEDLLLGLLLAQGYFDSGDYKRSLEILRNELEKHPLDAYLHYNLGDYSFKLGLLDDAIFHLKTTTDICFVKLTRHQTPRTEINFIQQFFFPALEKLISSYIYACYYLKGARIIRDYLDIYGTGQLYEKIERMMWKFFTYIPYKKVSWELLKELPEESKKLIRPLLQMKFLDRAGIKEVKKDYGEYIKEEYFEKNFDEVINNLPQFHKYFHSNNEFHDLDYLYNNHIYFLEHHGQ